MLTDQEKFDLLADTWAWLRPYTYSDGACSVLGSHVVPDKLAERYRAFLHGEQDDSI